MQASIDSFAKFHSSEWKERKLSWAHSLGTVTLIARFPSGDKELSLSLHQAVVMMLFEDNLKLKFNDILEETGIGTCRRVPLSVIVLIYMLVLDDREKRSQTNYAITCTWQETCAC